VTRRRVPHFDPVTALRVEAGSSLLPAVPLDRLAPGALRNRLQAQPDWSPESHGDPPLSQGPGDSARALTPASVLIPIVLRSASPTVLLTRRTAHLNDHAGQIAFPGGRRDPADLSPQHTALREAQEEVGLTAEFVEILGQMPDYRTITQYVVTPVVALVQPGFSLAVDPFEVAEAFEVPLAYLMNPANHHQRAVPAGPEDPGGRRFWAMPWQDNGQEYFIWGATAAMLRNLYQLLSA